MPSDRGQRYRQVALIRETYKRAAQELRVLASVLELEPDVGEQLREIAEDLAFRADLRAAEALQ